jgi:hypothetical protein
VVGEEERVGVAGREVQDERQVATVAQDIDSGVVLSGYDEARAGRPGLGCVLG